MYKKRIPVLLAIVFLYAGCLAQKVDLLVVNKVKSNGNFQGSVALVNYGSGKILKTISVGKEPHEICISDDKKYALVSNTGSYKEPNNTLSLIDLKSQIELYQIDLGDLYNPHGLFYHKGLFYFTAEGSRAIGAYDPDINQVVWINGSGQDQTHMLALTKDGNRIIATNRGSNTLSIYELQGEDPLKAGSWKHTIVPVGDKPEGIALSSDSKFAWIGLRDKGEIAIVDIDSKKVLEKFDIPEIAGIARLKFSLDENYIVAAGSREGNAVIIDVKTHQTLKNYPLGKGTESIFIHPDGKHVLIGTTEENKITEIDLGSLQVTRTIEGFDGPDAMVWIGETELALDTQTLPQGKRKFFGRTLVISPEVHSDNSVTFRLDAPQAQNVNVHLSGSKAMPMKREADGSWTVRTEPLKPDVYPYTFSIDGVTLLDPVNADISSGYQIRAGSSLVEIPGKTSQIWEQRAVPHGTVTHHFYQSGKIGTDSNMFVYTPPGYDAKRQTPYPTVYLLHGLTENAESWFTTGKANFIIDNLIAEGKVEPMLIVCPLGYGDTKNITEGYGGPFETFTESLLQEIVPFVEKNYHVGTSAKERAISGLSMGGGQSLYIGLNYPDQFGYVGGFSPAVVMYGMNRDRSTVQNPELLLDSTLFQTVFPDINSKLNNDLALLYIATGEEDGEFAFSMEFKLWLKSLEIEFEEVILPGQHTWMVWKKNFEDFSQLLFQ